MNTEQLQVEIEGVKDRLRDLALREIQLQQDIYKFQNRLRELCSHPMSSLKSQEWQDPDSDISYAVKHVICEICGAVTQKCCEDCTAIYPEGSCGVGVQ